MKKIIILGIFASLIFSGCSTTTQPSEMDQFAQCLTEKGITMYGTPTCPYCIRQRDMFEDSFKHISYVDCSQEGSRCGNIRGVPARELADGSMMEGMLPLQTLATVSNCTLPTIN